MNTETQQEQQQDNTEAQESTAVPSERVDISAADLGDPDAGDDAGNGDGNEGGEGGEQADGGSGGDDAGSKDPSRQAIDGLKGDLIDTRKELRKSRERIEELERAEAERQAAVARAATRDYEKELSDLDEKYDNGDIEDFKTYQKQREQIVTDRASELAVAAHIERIAKEQDEQAQKAWTASVDEFLADEANAVFNEDTIMANALSAAIQVEVGKGITDHATILSNARKALSERFDIPDAGKLSPEAETRARRQREQAKATASGAAAAPSPASAGGSGMRSNSSGGELSESTANNDWRGMSKAQQDEALGKPA